MSYNDKYAIASKVESAILRYLIILEGLGRIHGKSAESCGAPRLELFQATARATGITLTAGYFNRTIDDMKTVGLLGTAKGGQVVFLTPAGRIQLENDIAKFVQEFSVITDAG